MKSMWKMLALLACCATPLFAQGPRFIGADAELGEPVSFQGDEWIEPVPEAQMQPYAVAEGAPIELFECVKYKDTRKIAPCAVPMIVTIKDPCACRDACNCCETPCVAVQICVPDCGCPCIKVSRDGYRVKYDYGKYEVVLVSYPRRGLVTVNYNH